MKDSTQKKKEARAPFYRLNSQLSHRLYKGTGPVKILTFKPCSVSVFTAASCTTPFACSRPWEVLTSGLCGCSPSLTTVVVVVPRPSPSLRIQIWPCINCSGEGKTFRVLGVWNEVKWALLKFVSVLGA